MAYLTFISDKDFVLAISKVIEIIKTAELNGDSRLSKNVLDPFSALFQGVTHSITYNEWLKQEKARQLQKTMQNSIGDFHQQILGSITGWRNLGVGGGLDIVSEKMKIIAEVKNKFNTTKGNHKIEIYDAIKSMLEKDEYAGYVGYYVEIIPQAKNEYDKPFTPPDNKTKKSRPTNKNIRVIDGASFYYLATGSKAALQELYEAISKVLVKEFNYKLSKEEALKYFELFKMAFSVK